LFRAERPQKGRLREFFQWNIDIIGVDDVLADAEVIFTTVDYLDKEVGLKPRDVQVKISSRKLLGSSLRNIGIAENQLDSLYALLDKYGKIPSDTFEKILVEKVPDSGMAGKIMDFMGTTALAEVPEIVGGNREIDEAIQELAHLKELLSQMGVWRYCGFYPNIVRGLAYYTSVVFEVHAIGGELRAIAGGGRYDNLLKDFGGPEITGTGMGMGDCVLEILLREKGLLDKELLERRLDFFVACVPNISFDDEEGVVKSTPEDEVVRLTARLRTMGFCADFSYKFNNLGKQVKQASNRNARKCIIIGNEFKKGQLVVKDMATREQELIELDKFFAELKS